MLKNISLYLIRWSVNIERAPVRSPWYRFFNLSQYWCTYVSTYLPTNTDSNTIIVCITYLLLYTHSHENKLILIHPKLFYLQGDVTNKVSKTKFISKLNINHLKSGSSNGVKSNRQISKSLKKSRGQNIPKGRLNHSGIRGIRQVNHH